MSLSKHHSDMTRHPFFFMQEEGDTPRNHGEMEYEETPCFNQLDGSLKKLRQSSIPPRSRNKPEKLVFSNSLDQSEKMHKQRSHVSFDSAGPFSDASTRLATELTVEQFKNASRCSFTPLPVEEGKAEDEEDCDPLLDLDQGTTEKKKRDAEVAKIFKQASIPKKEVTESRPSSKEPPFGSKLLNKLESVLTYNAKMYRKRAAEQGAKRSALLSSCDDRPDSVVQSIADGSLNLGRPPKYPGFTANGIPTPVNVSLAHLENLPGINSSSIISPNPFSSLSSVRRASEVSSRVNLSTSNLRPMKISNFIDHSQFSSNSNLTCTSKTDLTRLNKKEPLFVTSVFPRTQHYMENKRAAQTFDELERSLSNNQTRLSRASSVLNSVRVLGASLFQTQKQDSIKPRPTKAPTREIESIITGSSKIRQGESLNARKKKRAQPSLSSVDFQNKSFVVETVAKKRYSSFHK